MPQFTLRTLLLGVAIVAGYCALLARWPVLFGVLLIPLGILGLAYWAQMAGRKVDVVSIGAFLIVVMLLIALLLPAVGSGPPTRRSVCVTKLKIIGLALANYHSANGCYPPAYVADAQGRPLVSWRVLLLPYMGERSLYDQWKQHRDEPWNGPNNIKLTQKVLEVFHCPSDAGAATDTSYVVITGPGTIWPGKAQVSNSQITDGTSNTLLLVEVVNSGINWMEPRDLDLTKRSPGINARTGLGVSSNHPGVVCVQFADGRAMTLNENTTEQELRALLTIAGGEKVSPR